MCQTMGRTVVPMICSGVPPDVALVMAELLLSLYGTLLLKDFDQYREDVCIYDNLRIIRGSGVGYGGKKVISRISKSRTQIS